MASSDDLYSTLQDSDVPDDQVGSIKNRFIRCWRTPPCFPSTQNSLTNSCLRTATEDELHRAPFGLIKLDDAGIVQFYNHYESELSGIDPSEAIGKDFFTQLAPCSNNNLFLGRFEDGVHTDDLDEHFTYTFTYKMRPTRVNVRLFRDESGSNWILARRR